MPAPGPIYRFVAWLYELGLSVALYFPRTTLLLSLAAAARGDRHLAARHAEEVERLCAAWQIPLAAQWLRGQRDRYGF